VDFEGEFFQVSSARIRPPPTPPIPIVNSGSGGPAIRRTARFGDGWLGLFCSARRFGETREQVLAEAREFAREPAWFGLTVWCGLDPDEDTARRRRSGPALAENLIRACQAACLYSLRTPPKRGHRWMA